jgi:mannose-6-phosphate isomerase-like protein (cupin superfamily)
MGGPMVIKARSETTDGSLAFLENLVPPLEGPPLHSHAREDEMWYVLEGHFRFKADGQLLDGPAGSFVFVPRGVAHCFQNIGAVEAKILMMFTPAGMERFFERRAELPNGPVDVTDYRSIAHASWMELLGPPLAESDPL